MKGVVQIKQEVHPKMLHPEQEFGFGLFFVLARLALGVLYLLLCIEIDVLNLVTVINRRIFRFLDVLCVEVIEF
jgi:hypothetical protein